MRRLLLDDTDGYTKSESGMLVRYTNNDGIQKEIEVLVLGDPDLAYLALESAAKAEVEGLATIEPLIGDQPRGTKAKKLPSLSDLMKLHGISELFYEVDGKVVRLE
jgi:hypothetical protein